MGLAAGLAGLPAGCAGHPPAAAAVGPASPEPTREVVIGDWNDVDAAVRTAVRRCQVALEKRTEYRREEGGPVTVVDYALKTVRGDSGRLRVRRLDAEGDLEVTCRIGAFGSSGAETCIVEHVEMRLRKLRGRDFSPLAD